MPLLCITSPKGGVGKTTLAANLGAEMTRRHERALVVDLDPQNSLGLHFGMDLRDTAGFAGQLREGLDPRTAWRAAVRTSSSGVPYLPYGQANLDHANAIAYAVAGQPQMLTASLRDMLATPGLTVIVDLPPGPSAMLSALIPLAALIVVVLLVDAASLAQIPAIESGRAYGKVPPARLGFVLNQLDIRTRLGRASAESAARYLGARLLGVVYRDENVQEAIASQGLVGDYAPASKAAADIAALAANVSRRLAPASNPLTEEAYR